MAFQHFTECIAPERFETRSIPGIIAQAALFAGIFAAYAAATGHWICLAFAGLLGFCMYWVLYCENWLFERLICLGGDVDAIGMVINVDPPRFKVNLFDPDNDYTFDLLLQCTEFGVEAGDPALEASPYGVLIEERPVILALKPKVPGYISHGNIISANNTKSATLHCEFEGSVVHDLYLVMKALLGITALAFAACLIVPLIVSVIILIVLGILILLGLIGTQLTHPGSPSDVNPDLPTIHSNHEDSDGNLRGADVLYVQGTWIYDTLHDGHNEIHPIKACCKIGCWNGDWTNTNCHPEEGPTGYDRACLGTTEPPIILRLRKGFEEAQAEETLANQGRPEHQWHFHPDLDGCVAEVIL